MSDEESDPNAGFADDDHDLYPHHWTAHQPQRRRKRPAAASTGKTQSDIQLTNALKEIEEKKKKMEELEAFKLKVGKTEEKKKTYKKRKEEREAKETKIRKDLECKNLLSEMLGLKGWTKRKKEVARTLNDDHGYGFAIPGSGTKKKASTAGTSEKKRGGGGAKKKRTASGWDDDESEHEGTEMTDSGRHPIYDVNQGLPSGGFGQVDFYPRHPSLYSGQLNGPPGTYGAVQKFTYVPKSMLHPLGGEPSGIYPGPVIPKNEGLSFISRRLSNIYTGSMSWFEAIGAGLVSKVAAATPVNIQMDYGIRDSTADWAVPTSYMAQLAPAEGVVKDVTAFLPSLYTISIMDDYWSIDVSRVKPGTTGNVIVPVVESCETTILQLPTRYWLKNTAVPAGGTDVFPWGNVSQGQISVNPFGVEFSMIPSATTDYNKGNAMKWLQTIQNAESINLGVVSASAMQSSDLIVTSAEEGGRQIGLELAVPKTGTELISPTPLVWVNKVSTATTSAVTAPAPVIKDMTKFGFCVTAMSLNSPFWNGALTPGDRVNFGAIDGVVVCADECTYTSIMKLGLYEMTEDTFMKIFGIPYNTVLDKTTVTYSGGRYLRQDVNAENALNVITPVTPPTLPGGTNMEFPSLETVHGEANHYGHSAVTMMATGLAPEDVPVISDEVSTVDGLAKCRLGMAPEHKVNILSIGPVGGGTIKINHSREPSSQNRVLYHGMPQESAQLE